MAKYPNNKLEDPAEFEDVYAGPGMMGENGFDDDQAIEENTVVYEEEEKEDMKNKNAYSGVYAGPDFFNKKSEKEEMPKPPVDDRMFMCTYAGPEFMQQQPPAVFMGGQTPEQAPEKTKQCLKCGSEMPVTAKFCGACGEKFKSEDFCPSCGNKLIPDSAFCPECGAKLK